MQQELILQIVVFTVHDGGLLVFAPGFRLPSRSPQTGQTLDDAAITVFRGSVNISHDVFSEQLYTFSSINGSKVTVTYYFLIPYHLLNGFSKNDWVVVEEMQKKEGRDGIVAYAVQRLRWKVEYTNSIYSLLPDEFSLGELQKTYESVLGRNLDKRNFRRKILSLGLLKQIGKKRSGVAARPAEMYSFKTKKPELVKIFS